MSNKAQMPADEEIDIAALGESEVVIQLRMSKKQLAVNSEVFKRQFCGLMRKMGSSGDPESINLDDYSTAAKAAFAYYSETGNTKFLSSLDFDHILELLLLANKYQMKEFEHLLQEEAVDKVIITEDNLIYTFEAAVKNTNLPPLEKACEMVLKKCIVAVHHKELDFFNLWSEAGVDADVLRLLIKMLKEYRETLKDTLCQNCCSEPCLDGKEVKDIRPGLKIAQIKKSYFIVDQTARAHFSNYECVVIDGKCHHLSRSGLNEEFKPFVYKCKN